MWEVSPSLERYTQPPPISKNDFHQCHYKLRIVIIFPRWHEYEMLLRWYFSSFSFHCFPCIKFLPLSFMDEKGMDFLLIFNMSHFSSIHLKNKNQNSSLQILETTYRWNLFWIGENLTLSLSKQAIKTNHE